MPQTQTACAGSDLASMSIFIHTCLCEHIETPTSTLHIIAGAPRKNLHAASEKGRGHFFWPLKRFSKARFDIHLGKVRAQPPARSKLSRRQCRARGVCLGKKQVVCAWLHSAACEPQGICGQSLSWERKFLEIQKSGKLPEYLGIRRASAAPVTGRGELQQSQGWGEELSA